MARWEATLLFSNTLLSCVPPTTVKRFLAGLVPSSCHLRICNDCWSEAGTHSYNKECQARAPGHRGQWKSVLRAARTDQLTPPRLAGPVFNWLEQGPERDEHVEKTASEVAENSRER